MTDAESWMLKSFDDRAIPLKKMALQADINELLLTWKVSQTFRNTTSETTEAIYTFPVAWSAVLTEFAAVIGGERLIARALPRAEAEDRYESAHENGDLPILLNANADGVVTVNLGNLAPDEEVTLELSFLSVLAPVNGMIRFTFPFSAGERYSSNGRQGNLEPQEQIETDLTAEYPVKADFHIAGVLAGCQASVPSHPALFTQTEDGGINITVRRAYADRNLVVFFHDVPNMNVSYLAQDPFQKDGWVAACVFTPPARALKHPLRVDVLADCSASMAGVGIEKMREALAALTDVLTAEDEITFTRFGSNVVTDVPSPRAYTKLFERRTLRPLISAMEADLGGTELQVALHTVFNLDNAEADGRQRVVLLITDGDVWNIDPIVEEAAQKGIPVFTIGVGLCAAEGHLQQISAASGGLCEVVTHAEDMTLVAKRLITSARDEPAHFEIDSATRHQYGHDTDLWPKNGYCGTAVKAFARMPQRPADSPTLKASASTSQVDLKATTSVVEGKVGKALAQAAAYWACSANLDSEDLAIQYGLLTLKTGLILVNERAKTQKSYSTQMVRVPQMAPMFTMCCFPQMPMPRSEIPVVHTYTPSSILENISHNWRGFDQFVTLWSDRVADDPTLLNEDRQPEFWRDAAFALPQRILDTMKLRLVEKFPQLSDEQCQELVPAMVTLFAQEPNGGVTAEVLVEAAQALIAKLLNPQDDTWKSLKTPFCQAFIERYR